MQRLNLLVFGVSILLLCWISMVAVHELGHVLGAWATGGTVLRVVIHPLAIAHTEVSPNLSPGIVAWMGPLVGVGLPLLMFWLVRRRGKLGKFFAFFAGFCLIANGAYISLGSFQGVGDCGQMLRAGTPRFVILAFGAVTVPWGTYVWHRLGSWREAGKVRPAAAYAAVGILLAAVIMEVVLSSR